MHVNTLIINDISIDSYENEIIMKINSNMSHLWRCIAILVNHVNSCNKLNAVFKRPTATPFAKKH